MGIRNILAAGTNRKRSSVIVRRLDGDRGGWPIRPAGRRTDRPGPEFGRLAPLVFFNRLILMNLQKVVTPAKAGVHEQASINLRSL
jgi:hypothetical protein